MKPPVSGLSRGNAQLMKAINEGTVLRLVRDLGPLSRTEIARRSGLTQPTVTALLDSLIAQGAIQTVGLGASSGGRKPLLYEFNPDAALVVGIDAGGSKMAGGLANLAGRVITRQTIRREEGPEEPYQRLVALIRSLLAQAPPGVPIRGIGLGVPGVTSLENGVVTLSPNLGWSDFPLGRKLEEEFDLPVYLDNDANTILLGERWFGAAREVRNALCMAVGTGIGCAVLLEGQLYRGSHDAAGEVGYMATSRDLLGRPRPGRTAYGFLEQEAAGPGIARRGSEALGFPVDAPEVMRLAESGNEAARRVVLETAEHLGLAIANMACLLDPELVILTGGVMRSAHLLLEPIRAVVERLAPYPPHIRLSELKEEAGVLGGVALVLEANRRSVLVEV
ncbi:MAG: ROK family transcriptional regulator [Bacillota bacterium]